MALLLDGLTRVAVLLATADQPPALLFGVLLFPAVDLFCALGGASVATGRLRRAQAGWWGSTTRPERLRVSPRQRSSTCFICE